MTTPIPPSAKPSGGWFGRSGDASRVAAHKVVYDVTEMVQQHPGGARAILRHAGQESSRDFDFHSPEGRKVWKPHRIGTLERCPSEPGGEGCAIS